MNAQQLQTPEGAYCDPKTGLCHYGDAPAATAGKAMGMDPKTAEAIQASDLEIIYVGDPMCSWCWGISPALNRLQRAAELNGIPYRIVVGGLRPGGGDAWDDKMKAFIAHHWEEVNQRSGQPFGKSYLSWTTLTTIRSPAAGRSSPLER